MLKIIFSQGVLAIDQNFLCCKLQCNSILFYFYFDGIYLCPVQHSWLCPLSLTVQVWGHDLLWCFSWRLERLLLTRSVTIPYWKCTSVPAKHQLYHYLVFLDLAYCWIYSSSFFWSITQFHHKLPCFSSFLIKLYFNHPLNFLVSYMWITMSNTSPGVY